jgi:hypothetical protein
VLQEVATGRLVQSDRFVKERNMATITGMLQEAVEAAERLHEKHWENMMATGEAEDFNILFVPGSLYVAIRIGERVLWDSEDENDGEDQTIEKIEKHCQEEIDALVRMFSAAKP